MISVMAIYKNVPVVSDVMIACAIIGAPSCIRKPINTPDGPVKQNKHIIIYDDESTQLERKNIMPKKNESISLCVHTPVRMRISFS